MKQSKGLRGELKKIITEDLIIRHWEDQTRTIDQILSLIKDTLEMVVGEDEISPDYEVIEGTGLPKELTDTGLELAQQAVGFHARNDLRKEQRKHIKEVIGE